MNSEIMIKFINRFKIIKKLLKIKLKKFLNNMKVKLNLKMKPE